MDKQQEDRYPVYNFIPILSPCCGRVRTCTGNHININTRIKKGKKVKIINIINIGIQGVLKHYKMFLSYGGLCVNFDIIGDPW